VRRAPVRLSGRCSAARSGRGRLLIRRRTTVVGAADVDFDLREAEIESGGVTVSVLVALGNVDAYVPEGIDVMVGRVDLVRAPPPLGARHGET
jgi:hypothetical protein